jgi:hypothetical protein
MRWDIGVRRKLAVAGYVDAVELDFAVLGVAKGLAVDADAYGSHVGWWLLGW